MAEELDRDWLQKVALGAAIGAIAGFGAGSTLLKPARPGVVALVGTLAGASLSYAMLRPSERPKGYVETVTTRQGEVHDTVKEDVKDVHDTITSDIKAGADWMFGGEGQHDASEASRIKAAAAASAAQARAAIAAKEAAAQAPRTNGIPVRGVVFVGR